MLVAENAQLCKTNFLMNSQISRPINFKKAQIWFLASKRSNLATLHLTWFRPLFILKRGFNSWVFIMSRLPEGRGDVMKFGHKKVFKEGIFDIGDDWTSEFCDIFCRRGCREGNVCMHVCRLWWLFNYWNFEVTCQCISTRPWLWWWRDNHSLHRDATVMESMCVL